MVIGELGLHLGHVLRVVDLVIRLEKDFVIILRQVVEGEYALDPIAKSYNAPKNHVQVLKFYTKLIFHGKITLDIIHSKYVNLLIRIQ